MIEYVADRAVAAFIAVIFRVEHTCVLFLKKGGPLLGSLDFRRVVIFWDLYCRSPCLSMYLQSISQRAQDALTKE